MNHYKYFILPGLALLLCGNIAAQDIVLRKSLETQPNTAKTTATTQRLVAKTLYRYSESTGFSVYDSTRLSWDEGMGSVVEKRYVWPEISYEKARVNEYHALNIMGVFGPNTKTLNLFDANKNLVYKTTFIWNATSGTWDSSARMIYTYLGKNLIQEEYWAYPAGIKRWVGRTKTLYFYKGGLLTERVNIINTMAFSTTWKNASQVKYEYTADVLNMFTELNWDSSATVPPAFYNAKRTYLKFTGKDTTEKLTQNWVKASSAWVNEYRFSYDFSKGPFSNDLKELWNTASSQWKNAEKDTVVYDGGQPKQNIKYFWDNGTATWAAYDIYVFTFTGPNIMQFGKLSWNGTQWEDEYVILYEYDGNDNHTQSTQYNWNGSTFVLAPGNETLKRYYYEDYTPAAVKEKEKTALDARLYPNPATNGHAYLDYFTETAADAEIQVLDMSGRTVLNVKEAGYIGDHSVLLSLNHLAPGTYIVDVRAEGRSAVHLKLIR